MRCSGRRKSPGSEDGKRPRIVTALWDAGAHRPPIASRWADSEPLVRGPHLCRRVQMVGRLLVLVARHGLLTG